MVRTSPPPLAAAMVVEIIGFTVWCLSAEGERGPRTWSAQAAGWRALASIIIAIVCL